MSKTSTALCLVGATLLVAAIVPLAPAVALPRATLEVTVVDGPEPARGAKAFTDSVGVGVHWGYGDTPYGTDYAKVRALLAASGVKHVRGEAFRAADLYAAGIKSSVLVDSAMDGSGNPVDQVNALAPLAASGAVDAVEGPNEPDLFWVQGNRSYHGQSFPAGVLAWQNDLYRATRSNPATAGLTVIGPSLGGTYWGGGNPLPAGSLTGAVDLGNFHPYPGGNSFSYPSPYAGLSKYYWQSDFPSVALDVYPINKSTYMPPFAGRPMAATETGYSTWKFGQSERVQGRYLPRLFLENFRLGIQRTYSYELLDSFDDPAGTLRDAHFGLLRHDLTPKPGYTAVSSLMAQVGDLTSGNPGSLDYKLSVTPPAGYDAQYLHRVLLQKSDGTFVLALWHEVTADDLSPLDQSPMAPVREVAQPAISVDLTFRGGAAGVQVQQLDDLGRLQNATARVDGGQMHLSVSDAVTFVSIPAQSVVAPPAIHLPASSITSVGNGLTLDVGSLIPTSSGRLVQQVKSGRTRQNWAVDTIAARPTSVSIRNAATGRCLTAPLGAAAGIAVVSAVCSSADPRQGWRITATGGGSTTIGNEAFPLAIDVPGGTSVRGTGLILWPVNRGANQAFTLN